MSTTSQRSVSVILTGDVTANLEYAAANNGSCPGDIDILTLALGANTIVLPTGGSAPKGAIIIPPSGNLLALTLKGVAGDTGIGLHLTDPISISFLTPPPVSFVINAGGVVAGLRIVWT